MGVNISQQLLLFLRSVLLGGVLGLLYDLLRPFRRLGGGLWGGLLDAVYGFTAVSGVFFFVMAGDGELRVFILLGILIGAVLFFCLLSQPLRPLWDFWTAILLTPVRWAEKFLEKWGNFFKKLFSFWKKWFTIITTSLWRREAAPAREGEDQMAGETRKTPPKTAKKRPGSKLTLIILLALFLGIGVQFLNMYGRLQQAQEEAAVYAARFYLTRGPWTHQAGTRGQGPLHGWRRCAERPLPAEPGPRRGQETGRSAPRFTTPQFRRYCPRRPA